VRLETTTATMFDEMSATLWIAMPYASQSEKPTMRTQK
jgi:hypothetical protein